MEERHRHRVAATFTEEKWDSTSSSSSTSKIIVTMVGIHILVIGGIIAFEFRETLNEWAQTFVEWFRVSDHATHAIALSLIVMLVIQIFDFNFRRRQTSRMQKAIEEQIAQAHYETQILHESVAEMHRISVGQVTAAAAVLVDKIDEYQPADVEIKHAVESQGADSKPAEVGTIAEYSPEPLSMPCYANPRQAALDDQAAAQSLSDSYAAAVPDNGSGWNCVIWYATNRTPHMVKISDDEELDFTSERSCDLHFGKAHVHVPRSHSPGQTTDETLNQKMRRLISFGTRDGRMHLSHLAELSEADFWSDINQVVDALSLEDGQRHALVVVHGYNVSFRESIFRAAQLAMDLKFPGPVVQYSWPSKGQTSAYIADEATAEGSESFFEQFLLSLQEKSGADKIHILSHSMGNRIVLRTLERLSVKSLGKRLGRWVLAAPDVDRDVFISLATPEVCSQFTGGVTLYCSTADIAVLGSNIIHAYPRAGLTPPVTVFAGGDTVVVKGFNLFDLGHGYYAETERIMVNMREFLLDGKPAHKRYQSYHALDAENQPLGYFELRKT